MTGIICLPLLCKCNRIASVIGSKKAIWTCSFLLYFENLVYWSLSTKIHKQWQVWICLDLNHQTYFLKFKTWISSMKISFQFWNWLDWFSVGFLSANFFWFLHLAIGAVAPPVLSALSKYFIWLPNTTKNNNQTA